MMNTSQGAAGGEITLSTMIDAVAKEKGIDRKVLVETVEQAILKAGQNAFGEDRELEAKFSEDTGQVDLFMYMTVVEGEVTKPGSEITMEEAKKSGLEAEVGEELGFQIFYLPKDLEKARQPVVVFLHQRLDVDDAHGIHNRAEVRSLLEASGRVWAVFQGHNHLNDLRPINGIAYFTLAAMVEGETNAYGLATLDPRGSIHVQGCGRQSSREWKREEKRG
jgi:hypothetical protein